MRGFIGNTDCDWYRFPASQPRIDEVNFWQPSGGGGRFVAVRAGEPSFFRFKSPHNAIAGLGYCASNSALPARLEVRASTLSRVELPMQSQGEADSRLGDGS